MGEIISDDKLKQKLRVLDQGSAPSINLEYNLSNGPQMIQMQAANTKTYNFEPLDDIPFKNQGIKSKLETEPRGSQLPRESNMGYKTQKIQKDFKISRNISNPNQQIQIMSGTFDSRDIGRNTVYSQEIK
jgi:hypothetical protein